MTPSGPSDPGSPGSSEPGSSPPPGSGPPRPLTALVGREGELRAIREVMERNRLVTLTGTGGSGKTRLALEVVLRHSHPDGPAVWVDLASLSDPHLLPQRMAGALGIREELPPGGAETILPFLGGEAMLLVLDNCEHLVEPVAVVAQELLAARPSLRILATSREALGVPGERAWLVPPLAVPGEDTDPGELPEVEAVRLFLERARDSSASFAPGPEGLRVVGEICRRLDGIPLALELAAARTRVLSLEQIRDRLSDAFRLLTSGGRTVLPRHRTLRAAVDWSHDLLPEEARILLRRLSVFRGGFTLDGAAAVAGGEDPLEILDQVARLVDRSLVQVHEKDGAVRYSLLETIRQYAAARLKEAGEEEEVRARHARHLAETAAAVAPHLIGPRRRILTEGLLAELENLRGALAWSRERDPGLHVRMAGDLWWFWYATRHWEEARGWIEGALTLPAATDPSELRARLLFAAGALATLQARVDEGRPLLEEAGALARTLGNEHLQASVDNYLALGYAQQKDLRMREPAARALAWFRVHQEAHGLRLALLMGALDAQFSGDPEEADRRSAEAIEVARECSEGDLAIAYQNWSLLLALRGEPGRGEALVLRSLEALRRDPSFLFLARGLAFLGELAVLRGEGVRGARLLGLAEALREAIGSRPFGVDAERLDRIVSRLREELGPEEMERGWREGRALRWEAVVDGLLAGEEGGASGSALPGTPAPTPGPGLPVQGKLPPPPMREGRAGAPGPTLREAALRIRTLGTFELEGERVEGGGWSYARPRELLLFLLLHPRGAIRAELGEALWPDATPPQLKNSFHVTLHHLRKRLGDPDWILLEGDRYRLARERGVEWDAERFEKEVRKARDPEAIRGALELYRGDLLDGSGTGRWLEEARDHYRRLHVEGWVALARALGKDGDREGALEAWLHVTRVEELNEEAHRALMRGWAEDGARDRALRHFQRLSLLLRETLDAEPEEETLRLYRELLSGEVRTAM